MQRANLRRAVLYAVLGLAFFLAPPAPSAPAAEQPFYAGKTIRIISGFAPGGTIDLSARLFARYLPKYILGNPVVIVQTMTAPAVR